MQVNQITEGLDLSVPESSIRNKLLITDTNGDKYIGIILNIKDVEVIALFTVAGEQVADEMGLRLCKEIYGNSTERSFDLYGIKGLCAFLIR